MSETMEAWADLSEDRVYRYRLVRKWGVGPSVAFIMLNPSTADEREDDPTIRRCIGYAKAWGCSRLVVANLFAFRATDPSIMKRAADPIGPENDEWLERIAEGDPIHVVCGWGAHGSHLERGAQVVRLLRRFNRVPMALSMTKQGHPGHPLYLKADLTPFAIPGGLP